MNNYGPLPSVGTIWMRRVRRLWRALISMATAIWRGLRHPIGIVIAAVILLFVIADRVVPQRMAYVVADIGRLAWSSGLIRIGPYLGSLPTWYRVLAPRPFYAYAANRHSAQAQVDAAEHWATFVPDGPRATAMVQFWLYGAYSQGYLPAVFEIREQHNAPDMEMFRARLSERDLEQWRREAGGKIDRAEIDTRAINAGAEHRLNHGALAIAARDIHNPRTYGWDGLHRENIMPGELKEMHRRARRWFDFAISIPAAAGVDCDNYASVFEDIVAGRLHAIRTCIDRRREAPMTYEKWRRFLSCGELQIQRGVPFLVNNFVETIVECEKVADGVAH